MLETSGVELRNTCRATFLSCSSHVYEYVVIKLGMSSVLGVGMFYSQSASEVMHLSFITGMHLE